MIFINTRPKNRSELLTNHLKAQSIQVIDLPLLELVRCDINDFDKQKLINLSHYQQLVFVSEMAVRAFFDLWLNDNTLNLNDFLSKNFIAVGEKTAQVFNDIFQQQFAQFPNIITPSQFGLPENNEGLLQLDVIKNLPKNAKVLIIKGKDGRTLFKKTLQEQGIWVDTLDVYQRIFPIASRQLFANFLQSVDFCQKKVVLITSMTAWQHWQQLLNDFGECVQNFDYIVLQHRIATALQEQGIGNVCVVNDVKPITVQQALLSFGAELD